MSSGMNNDEKNKGFANLHHRQAWRKVAGLAAVAALTMGGAAACGTTNTAGGSPSGSESSSTGSISRAAMYSSIADLASASDAVVIGSVASQKVAADVDGTTEFTLSTIDVSSVLKGDVQDKSQIVVRQTGSTKQP